MTIVGRLKNLNRLGAECLLLATVAPYLREVWWAFELPAHFQPHIIVASLAVLIVAFLLRQRIVAALAVVALANSALAIYEVPSNEPATGPGISVLSQNLSLGGASFADFAAVVRREQPDILVLQEYTPSWDAAMTQLADKYTSRIAVPENGVFGIALLSRLPIASYEIIELGQSAVPAVVARFETADFDGTLVGLHLNAPVDATLAADRNRQLVQLKQYLQTLDSPFVVAGDFNNTPWSPTFAAFIGGTTWHLASPILTPTWSSALGIAGIPIDLALASGDVALGQRRTFRLPGTDHRGVRFDFVQAR